MKTRINRPWTEADDEFLKSSLGTMSRPRIAAQLGRTRSAVYARSFALGLTTKKSGGRRHAPLGTERVMRGKLERKVAMTGIRNLDWKRVQVIEWELAHGPIPQGMMLCNPIRLGDQGLRLITARDLPLLAACAQMSPEIRRLIHIKAQIGFALRRIEKLHCEQTKGTHLREIRQ